LNGAQDCAEGVFESFAIATSAQSDRLGPEGVLIWEAGENYHYARTTVEGRIIFGGEDDQTLVKSDERNAAIPTSRFCSWIN
jgi:hypothetical protein